MVVVRGVAAMCLLVTGAALAAESVRTLDVVPEASPSVVFAASASRPPERLSLTLAEAERLWTQHNRELRLAEVAIAGAEGDARAAAQVPNPQASLNMASISPQDGFGAGSVRQKRMDSVARLEQLIERGGKRDLRMQAADALLNAARNDRDDVGRQQRRALYAAYYDLLLMQERERLTVETAALYRKSQATSEVRYRGGDISAADLSRQRVEQLRAENDARQAVADAARARVALAYLIGQEKKASSLVAADDWPAATQGSDAAAGSDPSRRPDVRADMARLAAAEKARDLARALKTRDITVGVQLEHNLTNTPNNSFGVGVSAPLFAFHEYEGEIARAEADLQAAREMAAQTLAQAQGEIDQAAADLAASRERRLRLEGGLLDDAARVARAAEFAYARGATSLLELLDARRTWRQVQLEAANARADHAKALAAWRAATAE
ncbi:TolC family protein [Rhodocyclus gracilis]|nr:TolC family protein [Rhodocyclus gracilis]